MQERQVRVSKIECFRSDQTPEILYVSTPGGFGGYSLITCLSCGTIYAADVTFDLYMERIEERVKKINCIKCGKPLATTWSYYPDKFLREDGSIGERASMQSLIVSQEEIILTLPHIYEA